MFSISSMNRVRGPLFDGVFHVQGGNPGHLLNLLVKLGVCIFSSPHSWSLWSIFLLLLLWSVNYINI